MVLRKPYAFLIKNFRIIHLLLAITLMFVKRYFGKISSFFSQYAKHTFSTHLTSSLIKVDLILYLLLLSVIIFAVSMLILMKRKEKPITFYISILVYYIILLVLVLVASNIISSLSTASLSHRNARLVRDIYFILSFPQYFFIINSFIRGLGFDVKKFNFSKDLEELEISSEDNEEFEFVLGLDSYKYQRRLRRLIREIKYYFLENKFFLSIIISAILISLTIYITISIDLFKRTYKAGSKGKVGQFTYVIKGTFETPYDYNGKRIKENKKYVVVNIEITNNGNESRIFDPTMIYLSKGKNNYYNHPSLRNSFIDIGIGHINEEIQPSKSRDIAFIYEMDDKFTFGRYFLKIFKGKNYSKGYEDYEYSKFKINPIKLDRNEEPRTKQINEYIRFDSNVFNDSTLIFKNIEIKQSYEYEYEICEKECKKYLDVIRTKNPSTHDLLIISYDLNLNDEIPFVKRMLDDRYFFDNFLQIEYVLNKKTNIQKASTSINQNLKNKIFVEIPKIIKDTKFNIVINTRNEKQIIRVNN